MPDAIVVGAGPNGLAAANRLVDAGWTVTVLEAASTPGGAVKSAEVTAPGFCNDLFSAFYPLAAVSPIIQGLRLEDYGLRWTHAPTVVAHPMPDGRAVLLSRDRDVTAASVDQFHDGDGDAWLKTVSEFERIREPLLAALFRPFPPAMPAVGLLRKLGAAGLLRFARFATLPLRRWVDEEFGGPGAAALLGGNALHSDLGPEAAGSAVFGWLLSMLGQTVGFPVPVGGAGRLTDAMAARATSRGAVIVCDTAVEQILIRNGRTVGVRTADGLEIEASKAVIAAVDAPQLFGDLVGRDHLPDRLRRDLDHFQWDNATLKVDWALDAPIPWAIEACAQAGTLHLGGDLDALSRYAGHHALGEVPEVP
jgi:phytoene dehydrogenase-like protein